MPQFWWNDSLASSSVQVLYVRSVVLNWLARLATAVTVNCQIMPNLSLSIIAPLSLLFDMTIKASQWPLAQCALGDTHALIVLVHYPPNEPSSHRRI